MPETTPLQPLAPWVALTATDADWDAVDPAVLDTMLAQLHLIRAFEEEVLNWRARSSSTARRTQSIGQEGGAVGSDRSPWAARTRSTAPTAGTTSSSPRLSATSPPTGWTRAPR